MAQIGSGRLVRGGGLISLILRAFPPVYKVQMPKIFSPAALFVPFRYYLPGGSPPQAENFDDFEVLKCGFIRGKARRRREKIAILGTLNGDF